MGLLLELESRIPDRWFLRRLLPSAVFVAVAFVGGRLGQSRWNAAGLAKQQVARYLGASAGASYTAAAVVLYAVAVAAGAFAVPVAARAVSTLAAGAWPWWLTPVGDRVLRLRAERWRTPEKIRESALLARAGGHTMRAARLDARAATAEPDRPQTPTWSGDRLRRAADEVRERRQLDVRTGWVDLLLDLPEASRTALVDARDGYDGACETLAWSIAYVVLGIWWWPAALVGVVLGLTSWRWLRHAVDLLAATAEAVSRRKA